MRCLVLGRDLFLVGCYFRPEMAPRRRLKGPLSEKSCYHLRRGIWIFLSAADGTKKNHHSSMLRRPEPLWRTYDVLQILYSRWYFSSNPTAVASRSPRPFCRLSRRPFKVLKTLLVTTDFQNFWWVWVNDLPPDKSPSPFAIFTFPESSFHLSTEWMPPSEKLSFSASRNSLQELCVVAVGDEDAGCDHGCVHCMLAAVLHPGSGQAVLPEVRLQSGDPRLADQLLPVARLRKQLPQPDDIRALQPRLPHAVQGDSAVSVPRHRPSAEERELRRAVRGQRHGTGGPSLPADPTQPRLRRGHGGGRRGAQGSSSSTVLRADRAGGGHGVWTTGEHRSSADLDDVGALYRTVSAGNELSRRRRWR